MTFERWVKLAAIEADKGNTGAATANAVSALEALAAERAAERADPRHRAVMETASFWTDIVMEPAPRSYSHWGMHA